MDRVFKQDLNSYIDQKKGDTRLPAPPGGDTCFEKMTFGGLAQVFDFLYKMRDESLKVLLKNQSQRLSLPEAEIPAPNREEILVCVRLWLRVFPRPSDLNGQLDTLWPTEASLKEALANLFPVQGSLASLGQAVLPSDFTASDNCAYHAIEYTKTDPAPQNQDADSTPLIPSKYLKIFEQPRQNWPEEHTAAFFDTARYIEIAWTDELRLHLHLDQKDTATQGLRRPCLHLFHLASFLSKSRVAGELFPPSLCRETLDTLALLIPKETFPGKVDKWFERVAATSKLSAS